MIEAVIWDFGGVLTTSPFEAFTRYETERGLPADIIRRTNAANHLENAPGIAFGVHKCKADETVRLAGNDARHARVGQSVVVLKQGEDDRLVDSSGPGSPKIRRQRRIRRPRSGQGTGFAGVAVAIDDHGHFRNLHRQR